MKYFLTYFLSYALYVMFVWVPPLMLLSTINASAQWRDNRDRALDQMQRQHEGMQQLQMELWLQNRGDWSCDPVYGSAQSCRQRLDPNWAQPRRRQRDYYGDDDE